MQIEGELLESIITEGSADIRLLGRSEMVRVRNSSLVTLTGNNPSITGDMARRVLPIDIVPKSADPERDPYPFNPFEVVQTRRTEFLKHAFTIMRAYRLAGMPESGLPAVGSFDGWSRRVRDLIYWLNGYDISEAFRRNKAEDPRRQGDGALLAALHGHFGSKLFKSAEPIAICQCVADARRLQSGPPTPTEHALADAIEDVFGSRGINSKQFGY
jgi:putative DNA primase/helicase